MATAVSQHSSSLGLYPHNASPPTSTHPSSSSSSSTSSLNSSATPTNTSTIRRSPHLSAAPPPSRKIRFAPLPDPRRSVLVTDDGEELPIPNGDTATAITSCPPSPAAFPVELPSGETSSTTSVASSLKRNSDSAEPSASGSTTPSSMTNTTNSEASTSAPPSPLNLSVPLPPVLPQQKTPTPAAPSQQSGWPKSKGISFTRIFKRRGSSSSGTSSSNTLTPTTSIDTNPHSSRKGITTEEILTLGTINLFRSSTLDSNDGWNLTRWTSAGPSSSGGPARGFGVPLSRTQSNQSTQSYKSKTPSLLSGLRPSTSPKTPKPKAAPNRRGARMLNGRVYGSKPRDPNANPFANARDDDTSFVEWGYGGMGSVKGAKSAGVGAGWEKLGSAPDDDLEDSTGTAWLRKRREAREKKAEEEAKAKADEEAREKEKEEKEDTVQGDEENASSETIGNGEAEEAKTEVPALLSAAPTLATITESAQPTPRASVSDLSHHRRTASLASIRRDAPSVPTTPRLPSAIPSREIASPLSSASVSAEEEHEIKTMTIPMSRPHMRSRSASNATFTHVVDMEKAQKEAAKVESESESESETSSSDSESEDDDEEEDEEELTGKMVLGAGMEKVSWHRTEVEDK